MLLCKCLIGLKHQFENPFEFFNTCANSPYHDANEYCHGANADLSAIDTTKYDDLITASSVCFKRCDCLPGYKRKITNWINGTTTCVKEYFCSGASEDLTSDLDDFRLSIGLEVYAENDTAIIFRSGDNDDGPDVSAAESRSTHGVCINENRSPCFTPYQGCNQKNQECLYYSSGRGGELFKQNERSLCYDGIDPSGNTNFPRDNCKGTILETEDDTGKMVLDEDRVKFIPGRFTAKHTSVRFNLNESPRSTDDWFHNGRYGNTDAWLVSDGNVGNGHTFKNEDDAGDAVFHVLADAKVPDCYIKHVTGVAAQILDTDQDGIPDYPDLARELRKNFAHIVVMSSDAYGKLGDSGDIHNDGTFGKPMTDYFDPDKFEDIMGIEGPFGYLRSPSLGSGDHKNKIKTCEIDFTKKTQKYTGDGNTEKLCIQDIYPAHYHDPNIDLTHREVMKAIIGFGLQYVQVRDKNVFCGKSPISYRRTADGGER